VLQFSLFHFVFDQIFELYVFFFAAIAFVMDGKVAAVPGAGVKLFRLVVDGDHIFILICIIIYSVLDFLTVLKFTVTLLNRFESVFIIFLNYEQGSVFAELKGVAQCASVWASVLLVFLDLPFVVEFFFVFTILTISTLSLFFFLS